MDRKLPAVGVHKAAAEAMCSLSGHSAAATTNNKSNSSLDTTSTTVLASESFSIAGLTDPSSKQRGSTSASASSNNKTLQLPMFLSKTFHMIDKCDPEIATWSDNGDNFVVKNVEKFATSVLPLYFKHSNFSSFARQLNFYGFRKLRTDPILTNDVDPRTACYVRFFHEKFQKDKPELLHQIKRATKTDQQSKDDLDGLKQEVQRLKEQNVQMKEDFDRRLAELSYECNRRVTALSADYDKLVALVQPLLQQSVLRNEQAAMATAASTLRDFPPTATRTPISSDLLHSLSALSQLRAAQPTGVTAAQQAALLNEASKRPRDDPSENVPVASRARYE